MKIKLWARMTKMALKKRGKKIVWDEGKREYVVGK